MAVAVVATPFEFDQRVKLPLFVLNTRLSAVVIAPVAIANIPEPLVVVVKFALMAIFLPVILMAPVVVNADATVKSAKLL